MPKDKKSAAPKKGGEKEAGKEAKVEDEKPKVHFVKRFFHVIFMNGFKFLRF